MELNLNLSDAKLLQLLAFIGKNPLKYNRVQLAEHFDTRPRNISRLIDRARGFGVALEFVGHPRHGGTYEIEDWGPFRQEWVVSHQDIFESTNI